MAAQQGAQRLQADRGDDLLLDEVVAQLGERPAGHPDERLGAGQGHLGDLLAHVGQEPARLGVGVQPGVPDDTAQPVLVEAVDQGPDSLGRVPHASGDLAVGDAAPAEQDDSGAPAVHRLSRWTSLCSVGPERAYLNGVHGPSPRC